ncbi:Thyrostimulin beta-5 subunit [Lamellibrachia satsuma]|nr:Thyrostimulin beta-5 subunit [Lamellibrachia satsuma]
MDTTGVLLLMVAVSCGATLTHDVIDTELTIKCHVRNYTYRISKPYPLKNGTQLPCYDDVDVDSCWGRCDSNEIADYEPPYKQSSHPVCTYSGRQSRSYRLRHCHPAHPEPYAEVFDAVACVCKTCSADDTSCEDFNG